MATTAKKTTAKKPVAAKAKAVAPKVRRVRRLSRRKRMSHFP